MKKNLLAAVCCLVSMPVYAGEFFYDVSGVGNAFYGYSDYAEKFRPYYKHSHTPAAAEIYSSAGYRFGDETSFKLGLDLQAADGKEVEDYNQGKWGENIYGTLETSYGEFSAGQVYNAAYQLAVGAPKVGSFRVNNSPVTDFIANPNWQRHSRAASYRTLNSTYLNTDADAPKISYATPEFYRTKLAVSYTPDSYSEAGLINKHSRYDSRSSYAAGLYNHQELGTFEVESSLGYAYNRKNNQEVSAGLSIYRKGWTLGGSYRKSFTSSGDYALNDAAGLPYYFDGYRRGSAYNVGLSYEFGPLTTGISYFASSADKTDNKDKIVTWANKIAVHKYVSLYLAAAYAEYTGGRSLSENNRGYAFISGLEVEF